MSPRGAGGRPASGDGARPRGTGGPGHPLPRSTAAPLRRLADRTSRALRNESRATPASEDLAMKIRRQRFGFPSAAIPGRVVAPRRGVILPLVATLIVALVAILALVMDLGQVPVFRAQLQNAAASAALAGASALGTDNLIRPMTTVNQAPDMTSARQLAEKFAEV